MAERGAAVVVPVKAFDSAKSRLAPALDPASRTTLARTMADHVLRAASPLPTFVACDDERVAAWALAAGAEVVWTDGLDLNGSVDAGLSAIERAGHARAVVAHADLPFASPLEPLTWFGGATLVPDRREDGTNVVCVPIGCGFSPSYGPSSFGRHLAQLRALDLDVCIARIPDLQWDVDQPADLPALSGAH